MKKILIQLLALILVFQLQAKAQQPIDEEKVKKAVVLQKKMLQNPSEMMSISEEIKALKLNSAENKEVSNRMMKTANEMISKINEKASKMSGASEDQVNKYMADQQRILPIRDETGINAVLKRNLTDADIRNYCRAVHEAVKKKLQPGVIEQAERFYKEIQSKQVSATGRGNGAISCYLSNLTLQSIYIMGRVCSEESTDANNINNYAALLTNYGVEQGAIPMLSYLRNKYGKDPVVFSNLATAWMGLGELKNAEKYADSCIRYFPERSHQAHYVKCVVEESKGNRQEAVSELQQSIGQVFSAEKESMLRKLGGKMKATHFQKSFPEDAMGLSKFVFPAFPLTYEAAVQIQPEWLSFYKDLEPQIAELEAKSKKLTIEMNEKSKEKAMQMLNMVAEARTRPGYYFSANNYNHRGWINYFQELTIEYAMKEEKMQEKFKELMRKDSALQSEVRKEKKTIEERFANTCGDGKTCPEQAICNAYKESYDKYMGEINKLLEAYYIEYLSFKRKSTNELVYAAKYGIPDDLEYERYKVLKQRDFLGTLKIIKFRWAYESIMFGGFSPACINVKANPFSSKGLQRFEDIHCPPDWHVQLGLSALSTHCNKITLSMNMGPVQVGYSEDLLTGEWTNLTLEAGVEIGTKELRGVKGIDVGAEAGAYVEIDRQGISDYGVKGKVGLTDRVVSAEVEGKLSLMSGKAAFGTKAGSSLDNVIVAFK